jgi:hypothetical protein
MILEIQQGLVRMKFLPASTRVDGIFHRETMLAMKECLYKDSKYFEFSPKGCEYIRRHAR